MFGRHFKTSYSTKIFPIIEKFEVIGLQIDNCNIYVYISVILKMHDKINIEKKLYFLWFTKHNFSVRYCKYESSIVSKC